ncbi:MULTISPECIES: TetR/AcrR family transcriptional regulator [unclassified Micromonospora]|uniref:TetR/AcrR family transcriptional regulator n=1 Tax=unclassified Micromonospora TaxID=2617518 RepID=UPI00188EBE77|nr:MULTISPECIES: TetR/AcrR family transcriptional regulator [unclassified Micromonospora]MBF5030584.1 TetR/AcrR family transcriptional regulator [Micromonospora sp. ANENR4]MCZ7477290.1 TetR/AcrR family transcriptional regulator [Micromonospora sp. WMMC273]WBC02060.1 TetR/AcrR family transcriptional regulator [Micromonospora sp. WMMA1976]
MTPAPSAYHQRVAEEKRALIVQAATELFLESGYDRASLARIAESAGVSKATLFKQFPTKAALFDAIVIDSWARDDVADVPPAGDLTAGLTVLGQHYATLLSRPEMSDLFRIVIAELPRFPELARAHFSQGKLPYFESVRTYLVAEHEAGAADIDDPEMAATQFLGMISNYLFWPRLVLPDWTVTPDRTTAVVDEAVRTTVARYGRSTS